MIPVWLYFDIPYADDASAMRALLAFVNNGHEIIVTDIKSCTDIKDAVEKAKEEISKNGTPAGENFTLVYPLDDRMGLAWPVKDIADKENWKFSRHIPSDLYPPKEKLILYSASDDGSSESKLSQVDAQRKVLDLNEEARQLFSGGDMLPVMSVLRHALKLSVWHFGWTSPGTALSLRNLQYAFRGTGNRDNELEGIFLAGQLIHGFTQGKASRKDWDGAEVFLTNIAENLDATGAPDVAAQVRKIVII